MDLQIKLLSPCPLKGPTVTSSLCEGETATIGQPNLASPPGTLLRRKGEGEKEAFPRTCSPLCLSQCRIYPHQHTCQPDSYEPFSSARHERGTVSKLRCVSSIVWTCVCTNLCSSGLTMDAHEYEKRCVEKNTAALPNVIPPTRCCWNTSLHLVLSLLLLLRGNK